MEEIAVEFIRPIIRLIIGVLRVLHYLGWYLFEQVGWTIGWYFYRSISFGQFPAEALSELGQTSWFKALLVEMTGLGILGALIFLLNLI
jgi:hypothetical protein